MKSHRSITGFFALSLLLLLCASCDVFVTVDEDETGKLGQPCDRGQCKGEFVVCGPDEVCVCEFAPCKDFCCPAHHACDQGRCVPECEPDCQGRECGPDGCGGRCPPDSCAAGEVCNAETGQCQGECTPDCGPPKQCGDPDDCGGKCVIDTCGSGHFCTEMDPHCAPCDTADHCGPGCVECPAGESCVAGVCQGGCQSVCADGDKRCDPQGAAAFEICGDYNSDGCLEWGHFTECPAGETCSNGACSTDCQDECPGDHEFFCDNDDVYQCHNIDSDACMEKTLFTDCQNEADGHICLGTPPGVFCGCEFDEHCPQLGSFCGADQHCQPCNSVDHCGPDCLNCNEGEAGTVCIGDENDGHCGCTSDNDCPAQGFFCSVDGTDICQPCMDDLHCGLECLNCPDNPDANGFLCIGNTLESMHCGCEMDENCREGYYCEAGICQACDHGAHCGMGCENCDDQGLLCLGSYPDMHCGCLSDEQCPPAHFCQGESCVPCNVTEHCGPECRDCTGYLPGNACVDGAFCGCETDSHCQPGQFCSLEYNHCARTSWPVAGTGQVDCYDGDGNLLDPCPQTQQDNWFGQDAQYLPNLQDFDTHTLGVDEVIFDESRGLFWMIPEEPDINWQVASNHCNNLVFGGKDDWRLPTEAELLTLAHRGFADPLIDVTLFGYDPTMPIYWSASNNGGAMWVVDFSTGKAEFRGTNEVHQTRCVRGPIWGQAPDTGRFQDVNDHYVDTATGLLWTQFHQCCHDWQTALETCADLVNSAGDSWRLPSINEILSLVDYDDDNGTNQFPNQLGECWTSTTIKAQPENAWVVLPNEGWTLDVAWKFGTANQGHICVTGP